MKVVFIAEDEADIRLLVPSDGTISSDGGISQRRSESPTWTCH